MTISEIVNAHKFRSDAIGKLCRDFVNVGAVDSADYTKAELDEMLVDLAKYRSGWAKSNSNSGAMAKNRRNAEKEALTTYKKFGGAKVREDLGDEARKEYDNAVIILRAMNYDV